MESISQHSGAGETSADVQPRNTDTPTSDAVAADSASNEIGAIANASATEKDNDNLNLDLEKPNSEDRKAEPQLVDTLYADQPDANLDEVEATQPVDHGLSQPVNLRLLEPESGRQQNESCESNEESRPEVKMAASGLPIIVPPGQEKSGTSPLLDTPKIQRLTAPQSVGQRPATKEDDCGSARSPRAGGSTIQPPIDTRAAKSTGGLTTAKNEAKPTASKAPYLTITVGGAASKVSGVKAKSNLELETGVTGPGQKSTLKVSIPQPQPKPSRLLEASTPQPQPKPSRLLEASTPQPQPKPSRLLEVSTPQPQPKPSRLLGDNQTSGQTKLGTEKSGFRIGNKDTLTADALPLHTVAGSKSASSRTSHAVFGKPGVVKQPDTAAQLRPLKSEIKPTSSASRHSAAGNRSLRSSKGELNLRDVSRRGDPDDADTTASTSSDISATTADSVLRPEEGKPDRGADDSRFVLPANTLPKSTTGVSRGPSRLLAPAKQEVEKQAASKQELAKREASKQEVARQEASKLGIAAQGVSRQEIVKPEVARLGLSKQEVSSPRPSNLGLSKRRSVSRLKLSSSARYDRPPPASRPEIRVEDVEQGKEKGPGRTASGGTLYHSMGSSLSPRQESLGWRCLKTFLWILWRILVWLWKVSKVVFKKLGALLNRFHVMLCSILARLLFLAHSIVCIFLTVTSVQVKYIYVLYLPLVLMIMETFLSLVIRKNKEWKWFSPAIAIYQLCTVPSIWLLEFREFGKRMEVKMNITEAVVCPSEEQSMADFKFEANLDSMADQMQRYCDCGPCLPVMEQLLLLLMILGRWLLPRSDDLTKDQVAQLLLVNIAIASDILDLFDMMKTDVVRYNVTLITVILLVWSCSLVQVPGQAVFSGYFQFALVSTATSDDPPAGCGCFGSEMWSLVTLLLLDDIPFLTIRLVVISRYNLISYTNLFFASKNCLIVMLDFNRLATLYSETRRHRAEQREYEATAMSEEEAGRPHPSVSTPPASPSILRIRR